MKKHLILLVTASILLASCGKVITPVVPPATDSIKEVGTEQTTVIETPKTTAEKPVPADMKTTEPVKTTPTTTPPTTKSYTATEVATHSSAASCWLILDGRVFDVTKFIPNHPGGDAILRGCGRDATQMFSRHPESARALKEQFYIGDLK